MGVHVLHRVLDRDDVVGVFLIDLVDDGREGGGFAAPRGAGDQDHAVAQVGDLSP